MYKEIITPIQIRFSDVDSFRHVNNSYYNQYLDCGRIEYFQQCLGEDFLLGRYSVVIVRIENSFFKPTLLFENITVHSKVESLGEKSVRMRQWITNKNGEVKMESFSILSTFDTQEQCSFPLPKEWHGKFLKSE